MGELWNSLNAREIAVLLWGSVFAVYVCIAARSSIVSVLRAFLVPKVAGIFILLAGYLWLAVVFLNGRGYWSIAMLKDTLVWYFAVGAVAIFSTIQSSGKPGFFKDLVLSSFTIAAFISFVSDTYVLSLGWELVLVPGVTTVACMTVVADYHKEHRILRRPLKSLLTIIGLCLVGSAFYQALSANDLGRADTFRDFLLEPLLTFLALPFFYGLGLWANLEGHFLRLSFWLGDKPALLRAAKWHSLLATGLNLRRLDKLKGKYFSEISEANGSEEVSAITRRFARKAEPYLLSGEVIEARLVPFTLPANDQTAHRVLVDWRNTSSQSAGVAFADITAFDGDGDEMPLLAAKEVLIYCHDGSEESKIAPSEVHRQCEETGHIMLTNAFGMPTTVKVNLTRILEDWD